LRSRSSKPTGLIPSEKQIFSIHALVPSGPIGKGELIRVHFFSH